MAVKAYKPTTPARRGMTSQDLDTVTAKKPIKSLTVIKRRTNGRNNRGVITVRHRGGGTKRFIRVVNFSQLDIQKATVEAIEYDPNRSARIARIKDENNKFHYVVAGSGMKVGKTISVGEKSAIEAGNRLPLKNIPAGTVVHSVELQPGKGAQMVRSAGAKAQLTAKEGDKALLRLPSGEVRTVNINCMATIGNVGNEQHQNVKIGSAGRKRHLAPWSTRCFTGTVTTTITTTVRVVSSNKRTDKAIIRSRHQGKRK